MQYSCYILFRQIMTIQNVQNLDEAQLRQVSIYDELVEIMIIPFLQSIMHAFTPNSLVMLPSISQLFSTTSKPIHLPQDKIETISIILHPTTHSEPSNTLNNKTYRRFLNYSQEG